MIKGPKYRWTGRLNLIIGLFLILGCTRLPAGNAGDEPGLSRDPQGGFVYTTDQKGNRIPDFSSCGYKMSGEEIPEVPVKMYIRAPDGDATRLIQSAIDSISGMPEDENGFRGCILLSPGTFRIEGRLKITASGVVLRGSGMNEGGTVLVAAGTERMTLLRIFGADNRKMLFSYGIADAYVPAGTASFELEGRHRLKKGDRVMVHRPSTTRWIEELSMDDFGAETAYIRWREGSRDLDWDRTVTDVRGSRIRLDAPVTTALDTAYGSGRVIKYNWTGRIRNIGIENLKLVSEYNVSNPKDESHCWMAVTMENVEDAWVRRVEFSHFAGSAVAVYETGSRITVEDCISLDPVSEIGGQRRYTYFIMGQQCLFQRLYAEYGYHDFAAGCCAPGPNAFVECESHLAYSFSGGVDSWASGVLFDIVRVDGQLLSLNNRGADAMGAGWCAANSVLWQCSASKIECYKPGGAYNWAFGCWSQARGDGYWKSTNDHIRPRSLFYAQLAERLSEPPAKFSREIMPFDGVASTSPTEEQAAELTEKAYTPALLLTDWIRDAGSRKPIDISPGKKSTSSPGSEFTGSTATGSIAPVMIREGLLVQDGRLLSGQMQGVPWWRGDARPYAAKQASPAITRFVPGRYGPGYTDRLEDVIGNMKAGNAVALDHNYGLWYDRRRDDHERIRRMDGEVWAPFYELPFARSGQEQAWDGLSKYDLGSWNTWYWKRLSDFAELAEKEGILLLHQNYFQHNILEAGAHYADFPWRTANNINSTGFPEPPDYAGDKRIFMDDQFYDTGHPVRRELHRNYIRKCLDNFRGRSNVVQLISAEYTGPLHFMQFWLDVIREWEEETGEDVLVALSATKDVQDAILADPVRSQVVDIIDIRYWAYRTDGTLYAPGGGKHMAPRQHARQTEPGTRSFEQVFREVSEYRQSHPEKSVVCSEPASARFGWAVLLAGGSLPALPAALPEGFLKALPGMVPQLQDGHIHSLAGDDGERIYYLNAGERLVPDPDLGKEPFHAYMIDPETGKIIKQFPGLDPDAGTELVNRDGEERVLWITRIKLTKNNK